jgi:hypothetical protein
MLKRGFKSACEQSAAQYRKALQLELDARLPSKDLAVHLGVIVWTPADLPDLPQESLHHLTTVDSDCWSAVTLHEAGIDVIVVNAAHTATRQENSVMHELSHIILQHKPARVDVSDSGLLLLSTFDDDQEDEANWLGATLLLPRAVLLAARHRQLPDSAIVREFNVSKELLTWRLRSTGVDTQLRRRSKQ